MKKRKKKIKKSSSYRSYSRSSSGKEISESSNTSSSLARNEVSDKLVEKEEEYVLKANLPGFTRKEIKIIATNNKMKIRANRKKRKQKTSENGTHTETTYEKRKYTRDIEFPTYIDLDFIDATYEDGKLNVVISKSKEKQRGRKKIEIF
jgi:HSP20 family protein